MSARHVWAPGPGYSMRCAVCGARRRVIVGALAGHPERAGWTVYQPSGAAGWWLHGRPCGSTLTEWIEGNDPLGGGR